MNKRPVDAWKRQKKYGVVHVAPVRVRRNATGLRVQRVMSKEGVRICGIPFGDQEALASVFKHGKKKVEVRIDPNDLREITAIIDGKPVHLANQRPDLAKHTLRTWMAAIKEMTKTRPQDRIFYEHVLLEHANWFQNKIASAVEKHGLPSTEIDPETLDWFENTFCLKLRIDADPETAYSADMDTLLSGGEGQGIYSPEAIAAEKAAYVEQRGNLGANAVNDTEQDGALPSSDGEGVGSPVPEASIGDPDSWWSNGSISTPEEVQHSAIGDRFSGAPKGKGTLK